LGCGEPLGQGRWAGEQFEDVAAGFGLVGEAEVDVRLDALLRDAGDPELVELVPYEGEDVGGPAVQQRIAVLGPGVGRIMVDAVGLVAAGRLQRRFELGTRGQR
jgi:hypothetical protein